MTKLEALKELADKVEAGDIEGKFDPWFERAFYKVSKTMATVYWASDAYHGSLDAAKALHEEALPGWVVNGMDQASNLAGDPWGVEVAYFDGSNPNNNRKSFSGHDYTNPARAWLLAIIRALIAKEE